MPVFDFFAPIYIAEVVEDVLQASSLLCLVLVEWSHCTYDIRCLVLYYVYVLRSCLSLFNTNSIKFIIFFSEI